MSKVLSCYWSISINGKDLDKTRRECIESIDVTEQDFGSDMCTLKINDPNFLYIEDNIFVEEATVHVEMGWNEDTHRITFDGFISAIDIDFPDNGFPVLTISCLDETHLMNREKKTRSWDNVTRPEVVKKIAKEYGFKCVIESGYSFDREDTISQSKVTDIDFLESLAGEEREPFICKLVKDTIYYVKRGILKDPTSTLYYRKFPYDVVSFSPQINKETRQVSVTESNINTSDKSVDKATATDNNTSRDTSGEPVKSTSDVSGGSTPSKKYNPQTGQWEVV